MEGRKEPLSRLINCEPGSLTAKSSLRDASAREVEKRNVVRLYPAWTMVWEDLRHDEPGPALSGKVLRKKGKQSQILDVRGDAMRKSGFPLSLPHAVYLHSYAHPVQDTGLGLT